MKKCSMCGEMKGLEEFYKDRHRIDGHGSYCKPCFRARQAVSQKRPPRVQTPAGTKRCMACKAIKPNSEFWANKVYHDGLDRMCKVCRYAKHRAWAAKNLDKLNEDQKRRYRSDPARFSDYELKKHFGFEPGTYDKMLAAQDGKCAICGSTSPGNRRLKRFHVDHCHETGAIRGLLCNNCNRGIGELQHDVTIIEAAIKYITRKPQYWKQSSRVLPRTVG